MTPLDRMVRSSIAGFQPPEYPGPPSDSLRLDANTNLYGPNPAVERVLLDSAPDLAQYPSAFSDDLVAAIAEEHDVSVDQVVVGNGSDEIIDFLCKAFVNPGDTVAVPVPTFVMYRFYGHINMAGVVEVPLGEDFSLDAGALLATKAKLFFVASPNNPTGNAFGNGRIEQLLRGTEGIVVVDEAYADFCGQDYASRLGDFDNLVVVRTFSKAYALAAIRVGYAVAHPTIVKRLRCVKPAFTIGTLSERIAIEALRDPGFLERTVEAVSNERPRLADAIAKLGLEPKPTNANFMLIDVRRPSAEIAQALAARKILVRSMAGFPGLETMIRVTVGRAEHTDRLVAALGDVL